MSVGESILSGGGDPPPPFVLVAGVGEKPSCLICGLYGLLEKKDMLCSMNLLDALVGRISWPLLWVDSLVNFLDALEI